MALPGNGMRVLHVIGSVGPLRGGPSYVLRNLVAGLAERGLAVDVATTDDNGPGERLQVPLCVPVKEQGVTYWYFPGQTRFYNCSLPMARWFWKNIRNYDLVHIHAIFNYTSTIAAWVARAKGVPYIVRPLGVLNQWGRENRRRLTKKLSFLAIEQGVLDHAKMIHYTSDQERIEAEQAGARTDFVIIANPTDLEAVDRQRYAGAFRETYAIDRSAKLVVFLSRISRKKGLDLLIPAFLELRKSEPDAILVVAGDGEAELIGRLKAQVEELGLANVVLWPGFLEGGGKAALLADADVFVLPSYSENFGVAVVEALSFQVPVVVSDQVGIHREISENHAGVVVPCEVPAIAGALREVLSRPDFRSVLAANAGNLSLSRFSRSSILDALLAMYRRVVAPEPA